MLVARHIRLPVFKNAFKVGTVNFAKSLLALFVVRKVAPEVKTARGLMPGKSRESTTRLNHPVGFISPTRHFTLIGFILPPHHFRFTG